MPRIDALRQLAAELAGGELHLAANVETLLRIRRMLDDPDAHIEAAARLIQAEPVLSAQVVAVANSVAYNPSGREIADVRTASVRLGFATLRSLTMAQVTRQMAGPAADPRQRDMTDRLWQHTTHVAALCRVLARRVTHQDPEAALFVGLVHEIGGFYLLSRAGELPALLEADDPGEEQAAAESALCLAVLEKLRVPDAAIAAVRAYGDGYLAMPPQTLGDTLLLADFLSPVASPLNSGTESPAAVDPASIEMLVGEETLGEILAESAAEVESISAALHG